MVASESAYSKDYFVSPAGSDRSPGTKERPFATLAKACGVLQPGDTCYLRKGVYREVLRPAIVENASAVILAHNHPSGDPTPSAEDIRITRQLVEAGKIVDIKVLDHIIIGRPGEDNRAFLSMREEGVCSFS